MALVGVSNLHYAKLTKDDATGAIYETPVKIANLIEISINPNSQSGTLFADNGPAETASAMGEIEVEINIADLTIEQVGALLGHTVNAGVIEADANDTPPYVALGFEALKSNGKKRFLWLYKGKFEQPEENYKTKTDNIEFQTKTLKGKFVKREHDNKWKKVADEDGTGYVATTGSNWYLDTTIEKGV